VDGRTKEGGTIQLELHNENVNMHSKTAINA